MALVSAYLVNVRVGLVYTCYANLLVGLVFVFISKVIAGLVPIGEGNAFLHTQEIY